jgi:hypothetical protein
LREGRLGNALPMPRIVSKPGSTAVREPSAPSGPQHDRPKPSRGPNPFLVAGAAFAVGSVLAKVIDWRGHAHPRR